LEFDSVGGSQHHQPMIGTSVGPYRVTARLSAGGMGVVYRAEHSLLGKPAAIKLLHPELSTNRDLVDRFFKEAVATTSVRHPGIVEVFDFGYLESGHAYLVMELLEGEPLSAAIQRSRLSAAVAIAMVRGVCSALSAAHAKGIVHRDLKPDNIFLVPDADSVLGVRPKLLDFGIAKLTDLGAAGSATRTGAVMGTPTYMSPEQCRGTGEVDHRADLYSLGCVLYELVAGRPPFVSQGAGELIGQHLFVEPESPRLHAPELTPELERLILSLLAKNPAERPSSAAELAQRLDEVARAMGIATTGVGHGSGGNMGNMGNFGYGPGGGGMMTPANLTPMGPMGQMVSMGQMGQMGRGAPWPQAAGHAMPGQPTTLGGAAGPSARGSSRRWLALLLGGGVIVGAGVALALVLGGGEPSNAAMQGATTPPLSSDAAVAPAIEAAAAVDAGIADAQAAAIDAQAAAIDAPAAAIDAPIADAATPIKPADKGARPANKPRAKPRSDVPSLIEDDI
jgi:eukaryotic-like serine/threonine-protein kinase